MKGKQIYFTQQEIEALLRTLEDFQENVSEEVYAHRLKNGLGTAWGKIQNVSDDKNRGNKQ